MDDVSDLVERWVSPLRSCMHEDPWELKPSRAISMASLPTGKLVREKISITTSKKATVFL